VYDQTQGTGAQRVLVLSFPDFTNISNVYCSTN
jgi:hypothetical protein